MSTMDMTGSLAIGTLVIGLIIAVILLLRFLRKPGNRHPMAGQRERNISEILNEDNNRRDR
ncbi:MAG: hypothetical protein NTX28_12880 [Novosphingobium sp.]|nr:hypothetical protein [Novosphingobium sp.]